MSTCLVGLGSNLGDRRLTLGEAIDQLAGHPQIDVLRRSHFYETPAVGGPVGQEAFLNAVIRLETSLEPEALHQQLLAVENRLGRHRRTRWASRSIDLDLLLYDNRQIATSQLTVPHPWMAVRSFVLAPAVEIAGEMIHPLIGWSLEKLWRHITTPTRYIAITGPPGAGKRRLAAEVVQQLVGQQRLNVQRVAAGIPENQPDDFFRPGDDDPAGAAIELMRRRQGVLQQAARPSNSAKESSRWLVSDFWCPQSLAFADALADLTRGAQLRQAWQLARDEALQPTLLVVLTVDPDQRAAGQPQPPRPHENEDGPDHQTLASLQQSLQRWTAEHYAGPLLRLDISPWQRTVEEVTAAVLAMEFEPIRR